MLKNPAGYKHSKVLKWEEHPCLSEFIMRGIRWNQSVILQCSFFNKEITNLSSKCSERKKQQLVLTLIITSWKSWGAVTYIFSKVIFSKSDLNSSVCDWSAGENVWISFFFQENIFFYSRVKSSSLRETYFLCGKLTEIFWPERKNNFVYSIYKNKNKNILLEEFFQGETFGKQIIFFFQDNSCRKQSENLNVLGKTFFRRKHFCLAWNWELSFWENLIL